MVDWMKYVLKGEIGVGLLLQKVNINKGGMLSGRMGAFKKVLSMEGNPVIPLQKTHQWITVKGICFWKFWEKEYSFLR